MINSIYFSPTGNSQKIVNAIAKGFGAQINEIDMTLPSARNGNHTFATDDLIVMGVPVYGGRVPRLLVTEIKNLRGNGTKAVAVVTYGNRAYEDALLELTDLLDSQGFVVIAAGAFIGEHSSTELLATNRPNEDDLNTAVEFGIQISRKTDASKVKVPGDFPYVEKENPLPPIAPETNSNCIQCKLCAETCPTAAIVYEDCKHTIVEKCIKCRSCVRKCPYKAKEFTHPGYKKMQEMLVANFAAEQKEPELFFSVDI